jgi:hypothetical protein
LIKVRRSLRSLFGTANHSPLSENLESKKETLRDMTKKLEILEENFKEF